jgi:RNA polymerase sigma factor (sigma-70 family)
MSTEVTYEQGCSAMTLYFRDLRNVESLTSQENMEYGKMLKTEKRDYAIQKLIEGNLKLVVKMAYESRGLGLGIDDLIAEGNKALCVAAEKFDIKFGQSFATYAQWWVRVYMSRAINASHTIRVPIASETKKRQVKNFIAEFKSKNDREPTVKEICETLQLSTVEVNHVLNCSNHVISMNQKIDDDSSDEIGNILTNVAVEKTELDDLIKKEDIALLYKAINKLDEISSIIIKMRFGIMGEKASTLSEVSQRIGKTSERVRQLEKVALNKLKSMLM